MERTIKVFCSGSDQDTLSDNYPVLERYDGFVLLTVNEDQFNSLAKTFPLEDITEQYIIQAGEQRIDTTQPRIDLKGKLRNHPDYKGVKKLSDGPHHHLVQFIGPIKEQWLQQIKKAGAEPRLPYSAFTYVVNADEKTVGKIIALPFVRWVGHLAHQNRIDASAINRLGADKDQVQDLPRSKILKGDYVVEFFAEKDFKAAQAEIKKLGFKVTYKDAKALVATVSDTTGGRGAAKRLRDLSAVHGVRFIRERSLKRTSNNVAPRIMSATTVMDASNLELNGEGEVIAICDTGLDSGDPQNIHPDFSGRIKWISSYPITPDLNQYVNNPGGNDGPADYDSGHGTHVAGSVLGDGSVSAGLDGIQPIRGLAYKAQLVFQAVEQEMQWKDPAFFEEYGRYLLTGIPNDLTTLFTDAYQKKARIHSNSWGGGKPGEYDSQSEQLDRFVWNHKDFCILVACGNDGSDKDGDGQINPMSVTSPATAKNCITIGACESDRPEFNTRTYGRSWPTDYPVAPFNNDPMADNPDQVVAFSSRGPTINNRIKPEVVAPGTFILSTRSSMIAPNNMAWARFAASNKYFYMGGTSMATPLAAGATGLVRQYLRTQQSIASPSAAMLKATLICGATRLSGYSTTTAVMDIHQGYGRINLDAILAPSAPRSASFVEVTPGLRTGEVHSLELEIAADNSPLRVVLAYSDFPGPALVNNLNLILKAPNGKRYTGNSSDTNSLQLDASNNVEVVNIEKPTPGKWSLEVIAANVPQGPQDFALVYLANLGELTADARIRKQASPALAIPDNDSDGVSNSLVFDETGAIDSISISLDILHTYIGDLVVALIAPDQTRVVLHDRRGASSDNIQQSYDVHTTPELEQFVGKQIHGEWRLHISDHAGLDIGQLRQWSMEVTLLSRNHVHRESQAFVQIPDNDPNGISDSLQIDASGSISAIRVGMDLTHTWIGDLRLELQSPSGTSITLHDRSGGQQDNIIKTYDRETLPALDDFLGESVQGNWTLRVKDLAGRDVGKLNRWSLDISL